MIREVRKKEIFWCVKPAKVDKVQGCLYPGALAEFWPGRGYVNVRNWLFLSVHTFWVPLLSVLHRQHRQIQNKFIELSKTWYVTCIEEKILHTKFLAGLKFWNTSFSVFSILNERTRGIFWLPCSFSSLFLLRWEDFVQNL